MTGESKISLILKDFKSFNPKSTDLSEFVNISIGNYNPPSYIVEVLLCGINKFKNYGREEKVLWHTYFNYKNCLFVIRDWKGSSWALEVEKRDEKTIKLAEEIKKNIIKASELLNNLLIKELTVIKNRGDFYLNNVYHKLFPIYEFYKKKIYEIIKSYDKKTKKLNPKNLSDILNPIIERQKEIANYSFSLLLSFFSLTEFLFDVIYIFKKSGEGFFDFKELDWKKRFKVTFDLKDKEIKDFYEKFIAIRKKYRNPLTHGLTNEASLLVKWPSIGLVPISYKYLLNEICYDLFNVREEDALSIINKFDSFLKFIKKKKPYNFYMMYIKYGFPIPAVKKDISQIKKEMTTITNFKSYLDGKAEHETMIDNLEF